jgi:hypothetical protein
MLDGERIRLHSKFACCFKVSSSSGHLALRLTAADAAHMPDRSVRGRGSRSVIYHASKKAMLCSLLGLCLVQKVARPQSLDSSTSHLRSSLPNCYVGPV